jgi:acylphosphatase
MALHLRVQGRVQGVGFRYATAAHAARLGFSGGVRNCRDGSVEAVVTGSADACAAFRRWIEHGPSAARVERVEDGVATAEDLALAKSGFLTLPTA